MRSDRQQIFSLQCYTRSVSCVQVREAYLQFMITIAKMIREDKNMSKDDSFVQEEMTKVMELETEIANVSTKSRTFQDVGREGGPRGRISCSFVQQFSTQQKTHGLEESRGKMTCCAVSSPEIRASVCTPTVYAAGVSALVLAIFLFGSLLKQDNLSSARHTL